VSEPMAAVAERTTTEAAAQHGHDRTGISPFEARGEPFLWGLGGALALGLVMIAAFLLLVLWNGLTTFWPSPIAVAKLASGELIAGEQMRTELFRPSREALNALDPAARTAITAQGGEARRTLYKLGNYDFYGDDYRWVVDATVAETQFPADLLQIERVEWGVFIGRIKGADLAGKPLAGAALEEMHAAHKAAVARRERIREIERDEIGDINHRLNEGRLAVRKVGLREGFDSAAYRKAEVELESRAGLLQKDYERLAAEAQAIKTEDARYTITLAEIGGREKTQKLSEIVRFYPANALSLAERVGVYLSRWAEFLVDEPREANTEGGVFPAIFGTFLMTVLLSLIVAPFGVLTALYLREYAKQGPMVAMVRISVNNLAGVPSIVYGVFGLGFFAYVLGGSIDQLFYPERLPNPTFGTGGLLWASLTLALMTVPVVIVATEESLAAVPRSVREGSLGCGASKWQTIKWVILPQALPGVMTGLILAMARGAGEVAPLMLIGVVKLAPELPLDSYFPFLHLERSFMHLGFHIYDVGFQSRNSEAGKPMVFVTTLLLIVLIAVMNAAAIIVRNRLRRRFAGSQF
jgi:phosphate transport system permease protein